MSTKLPVWKRLEAFFNAMFNEFDAFTIAMIEIANRHTPMSVKMHYKGTLLGIIFVLFRTLVHVAKRCFSRHNEVHYIH